jgi:polyhydroxybutyrate depolymerase
VVLHCIRRGGIIMLLLALVGCGGVQSGGVPSGGVPSGGVPHVRAATPSTVPAAIRTTALPSTRPIPRKPPSSPRPSCGAPRAAGTVVLVLPGGRRALFAVPAGDDGHHRLPLVIGLPGFGRTSEEMAAQSRIPARAIAAGVLAVLPQGAGPANSWNFSGTTGYDDVGFLSALVTQLTSTECVDPARVVITGISDGGDMAGYAACAMPGRFRAVLTVAASIEPRAGCHPIRIVAVHGDADPLDPYHGGPDGRAGYPAIPPAVTAVAAWAGLNGCSTSVTTAFAPQIAATTYPCRAQLITVHGGGHTWPGGAQVDSSLGVTTGEYDATATVLGLL